MLAPLRTGLSLCALIVAIAGCGSHAAAHSTTEPEPEPTPGSLSSSCTIYDHQGDAEVTFRADSYVEPACEATIQNFGQSGEYWSETDPDPAANSAYGYGASGPRELICRMAKGEVTVTVRDSGEALKGNDICASLAGQGYVDVGADGE